jgi:hypothetical protein
MAATPIFPFAVWAPGTNQNSIPANDNALRVQALLGAALSEADAAPSTPAEDDIHIVGTPWGGHATGSIVVYKSATWYEYEPPEGLLKLVGSTTMQYLSGAWAEFVPSEGSGTVPFSLCIAVGDEATALTTGAAKITFRMPVAITLTSVKASLNVAQSSGSIFTVDINEGGSSILSTKLTIDNTETTSKTAATAAVISDSALAEDAVMTIDIDQVGSGTAAGLKVYLIGTQAV